MLRFLLSLMAILACVSGAHAQRPAVKPNIIVIVGDDMGYADVGFHGCKDIPTPNLDKLAKKGVRCTNGYVSGPYCSPTRAGLLTGKYQNRFGHEFNPAGGKQGLPVGEVTLADRLRAVGYATALIGKWHLGAMPEMHPQARGFQDFFGFLGGAHSYFPGKNEQTILRGKQPAGSKEYLTDAIGNEACAFIDRKANDPFFLYLAFNAVHTPMHAKDSDLAKFAGIQNPMRKTYAAMMTAMDDAIGKVMEKLREKGLEERTLIFFISDNGGPTMVGTTINASSNFPLRGSKRTLWEGGVRVPFVVYWKGRIENRVYDQPVISLDIYPTALAAASVEIKSDWKLDGVSLLPYIAGKRTDPPHERLFWRFGQMMAVRQGDWKLVRVDGPKTQLFNLAQDIGESRDLSAEHPDRVREMRMAWDQWNAGNVAPLWGGGVAGKGKGKNKAKSKADSE